MARWEARAGAVLRGLGSWTATVGAVTVAMALVVGLAMTVPNAFADTGTNYNSWNGYLQTNPTDCEYVIQKIAQGYTNPGNPWIYTYGSIDDGPGCTNHSFNAPAGTFIISQTLDWQNLSNGQWNICNVGPWFGNTVSEHSLVTQFGFNPGDNPIACEAQAGNYTNFALVSYVYYDAGTVLHGGLNSTQMTAWYCNSDEGGTVQCGPGQ